MILCGAERWEQEWASVGTKKHHLHLFGLVPT